MLLASLDGTETSFDDRTATLVDLEPPSLSLVEGEASVELHWTPETTSAAATHTYSIWADTQVGERSSEPVRASRLAPEILGYRILRDGEEVALVNGDVNSFDDTGATAGRLDAPAGLEASSGTTFDGVELQWQPALAHPGEAHRDQVIALAADGGAESNEVSGARTAPAIAYELQRDGEDWFAVGSETSYLDQDAPQGTVEAEATALVDRVRSFVELGLQAAPTLTPPDPSTYLVRAVAFALQSDPSLPAVGVSKVGTTYRTFWQRSTADADSDYLDVPGLEFVPSLDLDPVLGEGRHYRARFEGEGIAGFSAPARATAHGFVSVSTGRMRTCGLRNDGAVVCWGTNANGEAPPTPLPDSFTSVSAGGNHTCGLRTDDKVVCWGDNPYGQPPAEPSQEIFSSVGAGRDHTCAVRADGKVMCWGANLDGKAPSGPSSDYFTSVVASRFHTCGIRTDGKLVCWGEVQDRAPTAPTEASFTSVALGDSHTCAVRTDGKVLCWGDHQYGQAPPGPSVDSFSSVSAGDGFTCGVRLDGKAICWGSYAPFGASTTPSTESLQSVTAGFELACGVLTDGTAQCWGEPFPDPIPPATPFSTLSAGAKEACGIRVDGQLFCWGRNVYGQAPRWSARP